MRKLLLATAIAVTGFSSGFALAQTETAPAQAVEAVAEAADTQPLEEIAQTQKASWYGEPFALDRQDVVSFGSEGGPVAGSVEFQAEWDNTQWYFSSAENRDEFLEDPESYIPEFGGYCPVALASGDFKVGTAEHFTIVDDKLYVNYDNHASDLFEGDATGYIAAAKVNF